MKSDAKRRYLPWLALVPLVLLCAAAVTLLLRWQFGGSATQPEAIERTLSAVAPEPPAPPAPWKAAQRDSAAIPSDQEASELQSGLKGIAKAVADIGPGWKDVPASPSAPAALLVLPGTARPAESVSRIPRHERWEIRFPPGNTIDSYSRQLDFFKIELGVIGERGQVTYLSNLSAPMPTSRSGSGSQDQRLYLIWQRGALRAAAEELASRAKIDPRGKVLAHFCPQELEGQLAELEEQFAKTKGPVGIHRTIFGIQPSDAGGYRFYVIDQQADQ